LGQPLTSTEALIYETGITLNTVDTIITPSITVSKNLDYSGIIVNSGSGITVDFTIEATA
jgi:hypothetical protein